MLQWPGIEKEYYVARDVVEELTDAVWNRKTRTYDEVALALLEDPDLPEIKSVIYGCFWPVAGFPKLVLNLLAENADKLQHIESFYFGRTCSGNLLDDDSAGGNFSKFIPALPNLQRLVIKGAQGLTLGKNIKHKNLRHLEIIRMDGDEEDDRLLPHLVTANLPALETMILYLEKGGFTYRGEEGSMDSLRKLLSNKSFSALKTLGLVNHPIQDEVIQTVMESPLLTQLEVLHLSFGGETTDVGGQCILDHADRLTNLKELHLVYNHFSKEMMEKLSVLPFEVNMALNLPDPVKEGTFYASAYSYSADKYALTEEHRDWFKNDSRSIYGMWR